ncbi:hypothetical protein PV10_08282 [Exophiala mesophila]|uniref:J domain-containing protein n=1 Tax=Exophiala mesophila TaxID=212818 RepID=A0A0D1WIG2_EXOME|nr:uncharacterized protein PV10_08282 [Exophiala mesophila]KIV88615.1 hypothetical protein PV10_08282 [Exophiala mesophila]
MLFRRSHLSTTLPGGARTWPSTIHIHPRWFSSTPLRHSIPTHTHYDILRVPPTATSAELKKQFYFLSKETHPDLNKSDPEASKRFAEISESYSVLSNPEKRKKYDRDVMRHHHMSRSHSGHHRHHGAGGSGSSYAGSRPASGLSKRRSIFKGPPPSFYAHGKPSDSTRHQHQHQQQAGSQAGTFNASAYAEPGSWDPAFDSSSVFKTQTHEDYRRANRRAAELAALREAAAEDQSNFWSRFILVSGVIVLGISLATLVSSKVNSSSKGGLVRADGTRRKRSD